MPLYLCFKTSWTCIEFLRTLKPWDWACLFVSALQVNSKAAWWRGNLSRMERVTLLALSTATREARTCWTSTKAGATSSTSSSSFPALDDVHLANSLSAFTTNTTARSSPAPSCSSGARHRLAVTRVGASWRFRKMKTGSWPNQRSKAL